MCFAIPLLELTAEVRLGHTRLRKRNYLHSIPLIPQTCRYINTLSVRSSPLHPYDQRARVAPDRVHQSVSFFTKEKRVPRPNARSVIHSFIPARRLSGIVIKLGSSTSSCGSCSCVGEAREPTASPTSCSFVLFDWAETANDPVGLSGHVLVRCTDRDFGTEESWEHLLYEFYDPVSECDGAIF